MVALSSSASIPCTRPTYTFAPIRSCCACKKACMRLLVLRLGPRRATSVASQRARGEGRRSGADPAVVVAVAGAAAAVAAAAAAVAAAVVRCRRGMRPPIRRTSSHTFSPTSGCSAGRRADAGTRSKSPSTATLSTNTFATNLPAKRGKAQGKAIARARSSDVRAPTTPVAGAPCLARGGARLPGCRRAPAKGRSVVRKIP